MKNHLREFPRMLILLFCSLVFLTTLGADEKFESFLTKYCVDCHGPDKEKGDIRIDQLSREFNSGIDSHLWAEVIEQINTGDMPPKKKKKRPSINEISEFVGALDAKLKAGQAARMASRPPVAHYRLSRKEYQNTIYDLLGVRYDPTAPGQLNEDGLWHGYERIGSELSLSSSHVSRYLKAVNTVLDRAFSEKDRKATIVHKNANWLRFRRNELSDYQKRWLQGFGIKRPLRYLLVDGLPHSNEKLQMAFSPEWFGGEKNFQPGLYRMRVKASGVCPPGGPLAHMRIGEKLPSRIIDETVGFDITAPEDKPRVYEFDVHMEQPRELHFDVVNTESIPRRRKGGAFSYAIGTRKTYMFTHSSETRTLNRNAPQVFDDKGNAIYPAVMLDWIEWEGPIETEAEKSRRRGVLPPEGASEQEVADYLKSFAGRAWRRPMTGKELEVYLKIYRSERRVGESVAAAYKALMKAVLTSRHFIYLVEGDSEKNRQHLTESELASRLSYFLWSSMPDDRLLASANSGKLRGEGLKNEVDRLLSDSKINRLVEDFPRQWLQLHRLGMFTPDKELYPRYDLWLEESLRREPIEFFREMFRNNLAVSNFIDSDWTMSNARISDFYKIAVPQNGGFERVSLKPENNRGGLLSMGAVLGMTSDGVRHRPVHRGVWVYEVIFNKTPPPPPANVDPIAPTPPKGEKLSIRQKLEAHSKDPNCSSCHQKLDPYGFALDNYDAIGQWRTVEKVRGGVGKDPQVNASGKLPDGRAFSNPREFKQRLLEDRETFLKAFIEHLCTYALRRVLTWDDKEDIESLVKEAEKNNYGLRDIIRSVALSDLMRKR